MTMNIHECGSDGTVMQGLLTGIYVVDEKKVVVK